MLKTTDLTGKQEIFMHALIAHGEVEAAAKSGTSFKDTADAAARRRARDAERVASLQRDYDECKAIYTRARR